MRALARDLNHAAMGSKRAILNIFVVDGVGRRSTKGHANSIYSRLARCVVQTGGTTMLKRLTTTLLTSALCLPAGAHAADAGEGASIPIELVGNTHQCVNVKKSLVSLWLTSITVETENNWLKTATSVGAQADVKFSSNTQGDAKFPRAASVNTRNLNGSMVRAGIRLNLLNRQMVDSATSMIEIPVMLLKTKGDTALAKYSRAMINFSGEVTKAIPAFPYAAGVATASKLATTFLDTAKLEDDGVEAPNFRISHDLSRDDTCQSQDLTDGVHVLISDASNLKPGVIKTTDLKKYCFYLSGPSVTPEVRYIDRPAGGQCATAEPVGTTRLDNPQVIYAVTAVPRSQEDKIDAALALASLTPTPVHTLSATTTTKLRKNAKVSHALDVCAQIGLTGSECLGASQPSSLMPLTGLE